MEIFYYYSKKSKSTSFTSELYQIFKWNTSLIQTLQRIVAEKTPTHILWNWVNLIEKPNKDIVRKPVIDQYFS